MWRSKPTIRQLLQTVLTKQEKIMAGVDDLKAAVAAIATALVALSTSITNEIAEVTAVITKLQQGGGLSDADAEALAQQLQGSVTNLTAAQGSLDAETQKLSAM